MPLNFFPLDLFDFQKLLRLEVEPLRLCDPTLSSGGLGGQGFAIVSISIGLGTSRLVG